MNRFYCVLSLAVFLGCSFATPDISGEAMREPNLTVQMAEQQMIATHKLARGKVLAEFDALLDQVKDPNIGILVQRDVEAFRDGLIVPNFNTVPYSKLNITNTANTLREYRKTMFGKAMELEDKLEESVSAQMKARRFEAAKQEKDAIAQFRKHFGFRSLDMIARKGLIFSGDRNSFPYDGNYANSLGTLVFTVDKVEGGTVFATATVKHDNGRVVTYQEKLELKYTNDPNQLNIASSKSDANSWSLRISHGSRQRHVYFAMSSGILSLHAALVDQDNKIRTISAYDLRISDLEKK